MAKRSDEFRPIQITFGYDGSDGHLFGVDAKGRVARFNFLNGWWRLMPTDAADDDD